MGAQGSTTVDFGAFPGKSDTSVAITGQAAIDSSTSLVEAWLYPVATADHSADEHLVENVKIIAGNVVTGTGFTIYALNRGEEPGPANAIDGYFRVTPTNGTRLYGLWTVAWCWN